MGRWIGQCATACVSRASGELGATTMFGDDKMTERVAVCLAMLAMAGFADESWFQ